MQIDQRWTKLVKLKDWCSNIFNNFRLLSVLSNTPDNQNFQINLSSQLQVMGGDVDPRAYPNQKDKYLSQVLSPLNHYFVSKHGFTIEQAFDFSENIAINITSKMRNEMNQFQLSNSEKILINLSHILVIDIDDYCSKHNIKDKDAFKNYLDAFSCTFDEQVNEFDDPISENILLYKPIIKMNENTFVIAQPLLIIRHSLGFIIGTSLRK